MKKVAIILLPLLGGCQKAACDNSQIERIVRGDLKKTFGSDENFSLSFEKIHDGARVVANPIDLDKNNYSYYHVNKKTCSIAYIRRDQ